VTQLASTNPIHAADASKKSMAAIRFEKISNLRMSKKFLLKPVTCPFKMGACATNKSQM
jgi:hypothetical protein